MKRELKTVEEDLDQANHQLVWAQLRKDAEEASSGARDAKRRKKGDSTKPKQRERIEG